MPRFGEAGGQVAQRGPRLKWQRLMRTWWSTSLAQACAPLPVRRDDPALPPARPPARPLCAPHAPRTAPPSERLLEQSHRPLNQHSRRSMVARGFEQQRDAAEGVGLLLRAVRHQRRLLCGERDSGSSCVPCDVVAVTAAAAAAAAAADTAAAAAAAGRGCGGDQAFAFGVVAAVA